MSAFDPAEDLSDDLAFRMLSNSPVTLFYRPQPLADTTAWLARNGYQIVQLASGDWTPQSMHDDIAASLSFPSYYGGNLDALNDCLRDVVAQDYGWNPQSTGLVIVFTEFDRFFKADSKRAHAVLDILAGHSRYAALIGRRLLCLVQSDDPDLRIDPLGAEPVRWNHAEWLDSKRR